MPGARSTPSSPASSWRTAGGRSGGSSHTNAPTPSSTVAADTTSAAPAPSTAITATTSSGANTNVISSSTESSAYAAGTSAGSLLSSSGNRARSTEGLGGYMAPVATPTATSTTAGAPACPSPSTRQDAGRVCDRERHQHARAEAVDEPAHERSADTHPERQPSGHRARHGKRPGLLAQEEDDREAVDADRQARDERGGEQPGHPRMAQDAGVDGHPPRLHAAKPRLFSSETLRRLSSPVQVTAVESLASRPASTSGGTR